MCVYMHMDTYIHIASLFCHIINYYKQIKYNGSSEERRESWICSSESTVVTVLGAGVRVPEFKSWLSAIILGTLDKL